MDSTNAMLYIERSVETAASEGFTHLRIKEEHIPEGDVLLSRIIKRLQCLGFTVNQTAGTLYVNWGTTPDSD